MKSHCFSVVLLLLFLGIIVSFAQVSARKEKQRPPKYEVIGSDYVEYNKQKGFLLLVLIKPRYLNCEDMRFLAQNIKASYPNESNVEASFYTNKRAANNISLNSHSKDYEKNMEALRGSYRLNRITGEEYLTFAPIGNKAYEREELDLSKEESSRCLSRSGSK